jgi:multiple sugar transport system substrate-binding protein
MKTRTIRLVAIVAALAVLSAACGGGGGESASTTIAQTTIPAEQRQPATLTLWSSFGDTELVEAFQPIIDKCEADNPWLTIDYVAKDGMATAFAAAAEAGDVPDIIQADFSGGLAKLEAAGAVYPIDEFASRDNFDWDQFVPGSVKLVTFNGKKWGIPLSVDTAGLFFNQDTLDEAGLEVPTSFEELSAAAEALLVQNPDGSIERIGWVPDVGDGSFAVASGLLFGAKLFNEDGTQVTVNTQEWIDALNWQRSYYEPFGDYENFARSLVLRDVAGTVRQRPARQLGCGAVPRAQRCGKRRRTRHHRVRQRLLRAGQSHRPRSLVDRSLVHGDRHPADR